MGAYLLDGARGFDITVFSDVKMVAGAVESPAAVAHLQVLLRKRTVFTGGRAMNDDQIDFSHRCLSSSPFYLRNSHSVFRQRCSRNEKISACISFTLALKSK